MNNEKSKLAQDEDIQRLRQVLNKASSVELNALEGIRRSDYEAARAATDALRDTLRELGGQWKTIRRVMETAGIR